MPRYRLLEADGSEAGEAYYSVHIEPGETIRVDERTESTAP